MLRYMCLFFSYNSPQSAFSVRLSEVDPKFNFYQMFAPDLMHEFDLGVWKGIFTHLMRLLEAQGPNAVQEFDRRQVYFKSPGVAAHQNIIQHATNAYVRERQDTTLLAQCLPPEQARRPRLRRFLDGAS